MPTLCCGRSLATLTQLLGWRVAGGTGGMDAGGLESRMRSQLRRQAGFGQPRAVTGAGTRVPRTLEQQEKLFMPVSAGQRAG